MQTTKTSPDFNSLPPAVRELFAAAIAASAQQSFLQTLEITLGKEMVERYRKTESANYGRFEPLIKNYLTHYMREDVREASKAGLAMLDLARSIWSADA